MLIPKNIRSKELRLFWQGDVSRVRADWRGKIKRILFALNAAVAPEELDTPGNRWHRLKGDRKGQYAVSVSGNWRITFRWDDAEGPFDVELVDYHGD